MLQNLPFNTLHHKGLTIEGYSRAAVQSYWRIPELKLGFDLGGSPWEFMGTPTIFITQQLCKCPRDHGRIGGVGLCDKDAQQNEFRRRCITIWSVHDTKVSLPGLRCDATRKTMSRQ